MKPVNIILIIVIILILAGFGAIFFYLKKDAGSSLQTPSSGTVQKPQYVEHIPVRIVNKGEESEIRDKAMEDGALKINAAVMAFAKDNGKYPESDMKNLCLGTRICIKETNINQNDKIYLHPIPQVGEVKLDYYYKADNQENTYCVKTPRVLETASTTIFQCTQDGCGRTIFKESCE